MSVAALVAELEARGVILVEKRGKLAVRPNDRVTPGELETLRQAKADVLGLLRRRAVVTNWSHISLYQLDRVLEVSVPWTDVSMILAPGCRIAGALRADDPMPGRIWCVCEVLDLLLMNVPPDDAQRIAEARLLVDGTLAGVRALPETPAGSGVSPVTRSRWPAFVGGAPRELGPLTRCHRCPADAPGAEAATWARYNGVALCQSHAREAAR